jgi:serine/threonine protein kinase
MKLSTRDIVVNTGTKTAELGSHKGGARQLLREMAADLIKNDGTVKSGYLKLTVSGNEVTIKSNHVGSGATAATDLVKKLVQDAYGADASAALARYLEGKGKDKVGTLSFVKLIKELEVDTSSLRRDSLDTKLQAAKGLDRGELNVAGLRSSFTIAKEAADRLGVDAYNPPVDGSALADSWHQGLEALYGQGQVRRLGAQGAEGTAFEVQANGQSMIYKGFTEAVELSSQREDRSRLGDTGLAYSRGLLNAAHIVTPSDYVLGVAQFREAPSRLLKVPADRIKDLAKAAAAGQIPEGLQLYGVLMPKASGRSLDQHPGRFSDLQVQKIAQGLYAGLSELGAHRAVHNDIKLHNAVFDAETGGLKIIDFGTLNKLSKKGGPDGGPAMALGGIGTPGYQIPWKDGKTPFGPEADRYSFGITMLATIVKDDVQRRDDEPQPFDRLADALGRFKRGAERPEQLLDDVLSAIKEKEPDLHDRLQTHLKERPQFRDFMQKVFASSLPGNAGNLVWSDLATHPFMDARHAERSSALAEAVDRKNLRNQLQAMAQERCPLEPPSPDWNPLGSSAFEATFEAQRQQLIEDVMAQGLDKGASDVKSLVEDRAEEWISRAMYDAMFALNKDGKRPVEALVDRLTQSLGLPDGALKSQLTAQALDEGRAKLQTKTVHDSKASLVSNVLNALRPHLLRSLAEHIASSAAQPFTLKIQSGNDPLLFEGHLNFIEDLKKDLFSRSGSEGLFKGIDLKNVRAQLGGALISELVRVSQEGDAGGPNRAAIALNLLGGISAVYDALRDEDRLSLLNLRRAQGLASDNGTSVSMISAELVSLRVRQLQEQHGISEVQALQRLPAEAPDVVRQMNDAGRFAEHKIFGQQSAQAEDEIPGWLRNRITLADFRERAQQLVNDGEVSGNEVQRFLTAGVRDMTANMFREALRQAGRPPCEFAVLSLGSAARGEVSPFSDLEFAILLPRDASEADYDWFKKLSESVKNQVYSLGENAGGASERNLGFHWDVGGLEPTEQPEKFVGSSQQLIANNLLSADPLGRTMFANTELLFGSDEVQDPNLKNSWNMVKGMHKGVEDFIREPGTLPGVPNSGDTKGKNLGRWMIGRGVSLAEDALKPLAKGQMHVKYLSRLPMMLAQGLALERGMVRDELGDATNSTHQRVNALVAQGSLSQQDADLILDLQDEVSLLRVKAHFNANGAESGEFLARDPDVAQSSNMLFVEPDSFDRIVSTTRQLIDRTKSYLQRPTARF